MHLLEHSWNVWTHYINDSDWSQNSYGNIHSIKSIEELVAFHETIILSEQVLRKYMLFFMKENILPMWEDESNRHGGCFWFKIPLDHIQLNWKTILYSISGNTISNNPQFRIDISGIVLSPKKHYYIIQIWMKTRDHTVTDLPNNLHKMAMDPIIFKTYDVK